MVAKFLTGARFARPLTTVMLGCALVLGARTAQASLSNVIFSIDVSSTLGSAHAEYYFADGNYDIPSQEFDWALLGSLDLMSPSGDVIATLVSANIFTVGDPSVSIGFALQAGTALTNVTITSPLLGFSAINNPLGSCGGSFNVSDVDGNIATLTGTFGNRAYLAQYNGLTPTGTTFANLIQQVQATANNSNSASMNTGQLPINALVSNMSAQLNFSLTPNDLAGGTSTWMITPEPASLLLCGMGLVVVLRRRA